KRPPTRPIAYAQKTPVSTRSLLAASSKAPAGERRLSNRRRARSSRRGGKHSSCLLVQLLAQRLRAHDRRLLGQIEEDAKRQVLALEIQGDELSSAKGIAQVFEPRSEPLTEALQETLSSPGGDLELNRILARRILLEVFAPRAPILLQVEPCIALERLSGHGEPQQPGNPKHPHFSFDARDQVPRIHLDDERVGLDAIRLLLAGAPSVRDLETFVAPDRSASLVAIGRGVQRAEPRLRVDEQPAARVLCTQLMHRWDRGRQLVERRTRGRIELPHADRLGTRDQCQRLRLAGRLTGKVGRVPFEQSNAAAASRLRIDRNPHPREGIDIPEDRTHRYADATRKLTCGERLTALKHHQNGKQSFGSHVEDSSQKP